MLRDSLVRWLDRLDVDQRTTVHVERSHLLLPDVMRMKWPEARERIAALSYDRAPPPSPDQAFSLVVSGAHGDVLYLTSTLLTLWTIAGKKPNDIGVRTARALLLRHGTDSEDYDAAADTSLRSRFVAHLRLHLAGGRFEEHGYAEDLDRLVQRLDGMTERQVIPGRVFTPSTSSDRNDLLPAAAALLSASALQADQTDQAATGILMPDLALRVDLLRDGDATLRSILGALQALHEACEHATAPMVDAVRTFAPDADPESAYTKLRGILEKGVAAITADRMRRLHVMPIDTGRLDRMSVAIEAALLDGSAEFPFFSGVSVGTIESSEDVEVKPYTMSFTGIAKAGLVEPPMEPNSRNLDEFLASHVMVGAGWLTWHAFTARTHIAHEVSATVETADFWRSIDGLLDVVGPDPVLVVSRHAEARSLRRMLRLRNGEEAGLKVEHLGKQGAYVATFNGVDVHAADTPPGVAWLFTARLLRDIRYSPPERSGALVSIAYEPVNDDMGDLIVTLVQHRRWADAVTYELKVADPEDDA